jgi:hypothetical protein
MNMEEMNRMQDLIDWLAEIGYKLEDGVYYDESGKEITQHKVLWNYIDGM